VKVVWDSYNGRYSDNPRAIYEHLLEREPSAEHVWFCDPVHAHGFPEGVRTVVPYSPECRAELEDADLIVANTHIEMEWTKKPGARYLQTWHGTPLKRIHHDVLWAPEGRLDWLDHDVARWDYLLSPNAASTERLRNAFAFRGEMVEVGYPRNDVLSAPSAEQVRDRVRASLGLSKDTTAVLYTPTWRDDEFYANGADDAIRLALDGSAFVAELGGNYCLLPRLHYMVTARGAIPSGAGVVDVSRYPDAQELYLAADVMITDYSSTMFDYTVTGKPIIFYTYDLARYGDTVRGFYFDLEPVAPGPMVETPEELLAALRSLPTLSRDHAERYAAFRRTFNHLDDGRASGRLSALLDGDRVG
jgi:CDP-glycerol glycerophosphotransferase